MNHAGHETTSNERSPTKPRPFGDLSFAISPLGFGTSQLPKDHEQNDVKRVHGQEAREILSAAIDNGVNFFDTAPGYGRSEALLAEVKRKCGQKIIIATKAGLRPDGVRDFSIPFLESQVENSLRALNCDCLDIFQLNKPSPELLNEGELFCFLDTLKRKGKIKLSGVIIGDVKTGYQCIKSGKVDCVQVLYNLLYQDTEKLIRDALNNGLGIIIRSPLNSGVLTGGFANRKKFDPNDPRSEYFSGPAFKRRLNLLRKIQEALNIQDSELLEFSLRFALSNWENTVIIPAASKLCQLKRLLKFGENLSPFSQVELEKIRQAVSECMTGINMEFQNI